MREGWEIKAFDACIEKRKAPTKLLSSSYQEKGLFPIVSQEKDLISGYWDNPDDLFVHRKPVVVFGDHTMVVKYIDFDFVVGADGVKILEPKDFLLPKYFYYWVSSVHIKSRGYARHFRYLKEASIPIPSIPEQQRIVDILDREFAKIDALKANAEKSLQAAKDLFQATLKKELEPKGGWSVAEIGSVCLKTDNIKWRDIPEDKEYTYIDLTSVDRSTKSVVEPQRIKKSNAPSRAQRLVCEDDIIFATTRPTLRRYCIITEQYDGQICSTGFCVLRPDKRKVRPSWLFHCLSTDAFYDYVEPLQTGATYPAISDKDVKSYTISLPTITEQDDIVSRLNDLNDKSNTLQENYQKTLSLCDDLKQSLLRKAFSGEL